ncbi:hypothetical protein EV363DRAFT_1458702 [Boletus edulis]|nr:hypothetical protein EV363DRAFT_1458702 [Boletus edulis]
MEEAQIDGISAKFRVSSPNHPLVVELYEKLHELPVPWFVGQRMKLPCIMFKLGRLLAFRNRTERVFRTHIDALGNVEIRTREDLSRLSSLYIIHPWIDFLLDRQPVESVMGPLNLEQSTDSQFSMIHRPLDSSDAKSTSRRAQAARLLARLGRPFGTWPRNSDAAPSNSSSSVSLVDKQTQALRLLARLQQPFGALLFTPTRQNVHEYRRVAADSEVRVQVQEDIPLDMLIDGVRLLDVL